MQVNALNQTFIDDSMRVIQRDINCIIDPDRNIRKTGLNKILDFLLNKSNAYEKVHIFESYILKNTLRTLEDQVEKNREISVNIFKTYLQLSDQEYNFEILKIIIEAIAHRLNQLPFPEQSEELRLQLIQLLQQILSKQASSFRESLQKLALMISKTLQDTFPEVKKQISHLAAEISKIQPIGEYMGESVKILNNNMLHAHTKVRKATVESLAPVILSRQNGSFLDIAMTNLKTLSIDKSLEVRRSTFLCIHQLLTSFSVANLSQYENQLLLILLNGLSDDSREIQESALSILDQVGVKRQLLDQEANL